MIAIVGLGFFAAAAAGQDAPEPGELRLEECEQEGITSPAKCGTFTVWENRDERAGRTIDLNVVLLEATARIADGTPSST